MTESRTEEFRRGPWIDPEIVTFRARYRRAPELLPVLHLVVFDASNPHSVMFEVAWCVALYLSVLAFEFLPPFFEWLGLSKARAFVVGLAGAFVFQTMNAEAVPSAPMAARAPRSVTEPPSSISRCRGVVAASGDAARPHVRIGFDRRAVIVARFEARRGVKGAVAEKVANGQVTSEDAAKAMLGTNPLAFAAPLPGGADPLVAPSQSLALKAKLEGANVPVQMVLYPTEGHGWMGANLTDSYNRIEAFLKTYNP
mgnify:CR=1 FL=1